MVDMYGEELKVGDKVQSRLAVIDCPPDYKATTPVCTIIEITSEYVLIECYLRSGEYDRSYVNPSFMSKCYERVG